MDEKPAAKPTKKTKLTGLSKKASGATSPYKPAPAKSSAAAIKTQAPAKSSTTSKAKSDPKPLLKAQKTTDSATATTPIEVASQKKQSDA
jgi:hypothetical protein